MLGVSKPTDMCTCYHTRGDHTTASLAEARKLYAEADKLYAEARKLYAEGDLIWINAWIRVHGKESIVDWDWGAVK